MEANFYQNAHHYIKEIGALNKLFKFAKGDKTSQIFVQHIHEESNNH
jgi:hypothetical protein